MPGIALIIAVFVPGMIITAAQNQPLKFEVASVKLVQDRANLQLSRTTDDSGVHWRCSSLQAEM
jgi:hypothetical protein